MISVVIPVFNGARYIEQTLGSVSSQTLAADEVIVVDDGSTDDTVAIVRRCAPSARLILQRNQGPGAARNTGIEAAKADVIAFLDADDLWEPEKLRLQYAALEESPELDLVFCHMDQFLSPDLPAEQASRLICDTKPQPATLICCLMARRRAFSRVGPLRTEFKADFVEWYLRAMEANLVVRTIDQLLAHRRIHGANFTLQNKDVRQEYLSILKASLDRRRAVQIPQ